MSSDGKTPQVSDAAQRPERLGKFLRAALADNPHRAGIVSVTEAIAAASKYVSYLVRAAGLAGVIGATGKVNVQGESSQVLDDLATNVFAESLRADQNIAGFACEELESSEIIKRETAQQYLCVFDPIDGSSNIDVAAPIGSIFGLTPVADEPVTEDSFLQHGRNQVAALYIIYGSSTQLVLATRESVNVFTLDTSVGEYFLTLANARLPEKGPYYSVNEGNSEAWDESIQAVVRQFREDLSLRYIGTLVSDFHRGLLKGGIFLYPGDRKNTQGKLRLLYEANPLAFIVEAAGGAASSGSERILDIAPTAIHQRVPLFIGNEDLVSAVESFQTTTRAK